MIISRHFLRRTARRNCRRLNLQAQAEARLNATIGTEYVVSRAARGPYRWYVRRAGLQVTFTTTA
jgi:hypothetical protein